MAEYYPCAIFGCTCGQEVPIADRDEHIATCSGKEESMRKLFRVQAEKIVSGYFIVRAEDAYEAFHEAAVMQTHLFEPDGDYVEVRILPSYEDDLSDRVEEVDE